MKKISQNSKRTLTVKRETVRALDTNKLATVAGGQRPVMDKSDAISGHPSVCC